MVSRRVVASIGWVLALYSLYVEDKVAHRNDPSFDSPEEEPFKALCDIEAIGASCRYVMLSYMLRFSRKQTGYRLAHLMHCAHWLHADPIRLSLVRLDISDLFRSLYPRMYPRKSIHDIYILCVYMPLLSLTSCLFGSLLVRIFYGWIYGISSLIS